MGAGRDRGKFGGMVSRGWCPTAKKWLAYSTLLGIELFLAELCVPKHLNSLLYHRELLIAPIFALLVGAFMCLALVVAAYVDAVG